jgi:phosphoglycerol transferase MdoB-like AlkP superfamily enzyme
MKKILSGLILVSLSVLPLIALAQRVGPLPGYTVAPESDIWEVLDRITNWLFSILLVVAVIFIIIAAFQFITAGGDPTKVASARNWVLYALIGVAVALLARGLVTFVSRILGV